MPKYGVRILFRDKNSHTIETSDVAEAQNYLIQIDEQLKAHSGSFAMYNKSDEIVYVCNTDNLIHAMVVSIQEEKA